MVDGPPRRHTSTRRQAARPPARRPTSRGAARPSRRPSTQPGRPPGTAGPSRRWPGRSPSCASARPRCPGWGPGARAPRRRQPRPGSSSPSPPLEYVCSVGNTSSPDSGSWPRLRRSPGTPRVGSAAGGRPGHLRDDLVQLLTEHLDRLVELRVEVLTVQPGIGVVLTEPSGWSSGRVTWSRVVLASSRSLGTRKATTEKPPGLGSGGLDGHVGLSHAGQGHGGGEGGGDTDADTEDGAARRDAGREHDEVSIRGRKSREGRSGGDAAGPRPAAPRVTGRGARFRRRAAVVDRGGRPRRPVHIDDRVGSRSPRTDGSVA